MIICVWYVFFFHETKSSISTSSLKQLDTKCLLLHWKAYSQCSKRFHFSTSHVCTFHIGLWLMTSQLPNRLRCHEITLVNVRFKRSTEKLSLLQQMNESILPVSNSGHTSFCTVELKHPTEGIISKTHFWVEGRT